MLCSEHALIPISGYSFLARHYKRGDRITIFGFSRGGYIAFAFAYLTASQGLNLLPSRVDKYLDECMNTETRKRIKDASGTLT